MIDALARPKAAYHYLKRVMQPVAVFVTDEGQSGLACHVINDLARAALRSSAPDPATSATARCWPRAAPRASTPPAHDAVEMPADGLFDAFVDSAYAYRFGPPAFDTVVATLASAATGAGARSAKRSTSRSAFRPSRPFRARPRGGSRAPRRWRVCAHLARAAPLRLCRVDRRGPVPSPTTMRSTSSPRGARTRCASGDDHARGAARGHGVRAALNAPRQRSHQGRLRERWIGTGWVAPPSTPFIRASSSDTTPSVEAALVRRLGVMREHHGRRAAPGGAARGARRRNRSSPARPR